MRLEVDRANRWATLTVRGPEVDGPTDPDKIRAAGAAWWPGRA